MSLGFARDSVHDLSSLVEKSSKGGSSALSTAIQSSVSSSIVEGESSEVSFAIEDNNNDNPSRSTRFNLDATINDTATPESAYNSIQNRRSQYSSSYGNYVGFAADYSEYEQYGTSHEHYSQSLLDLRNMQSSDSGWWCCLLPWMTDRKQLDQEHKDNIEESNDGFVGISFAASNSDVDSTRSEDEVSTESSAYGEKLTDNERAAVVARLRLASPEATKSSDPTALLQDSLSPSKARLLDHRVLSSLDTSCGDDSEANDVESNNNQKTKPLKSILRKGSVCMNHAESFGGNSASITKSDHSNNNNNGINTSKRRSLFPQQYESKPKKDQNIQFAPMARVMTVKSKNDMSELEKSRIWWNKQDYEDFKKTGRIIAKAMCEGGSEVWLASNNAWEKKSAGRVSTAAASSHRAIHLSDRSEIIQSDGGNAKKLNHDKWWHHFGHSRRGLEHIASVEEGRQRQANVRVAIRTVIDEQKRQKAYRKEDPEKLRMLALQYSSWARELALAAAASDAEAVEVDFSENRKSREFYILKQAKAQGGFSKTLPSFMMPHSVSPQVLDHHTSTQIRIRRKLASVGPTPTTKYEDLALSSKSEPIHDASAGSGSLAKQAAGFGAGKADVSAILSGLGSTADENSSMGPIKPQRPSVGAH